MLELHGLFRSAWVVWLLVLFVGILVWVLWPSRRRGYKDAAQIPLEDDEPDRRDSNRRDAKEGS
jgi:cytochrome c oxidase cbb3-type subunit 4